MYILGINAYHGDSAACIFKDGKLVHFLERHHIEGGTAEMISNNLKAAYAEFC